MQTHSQVTDSTTYAYKRLITAIDEPTAIEHAKEFVNEFWVVSVMFKTMRGNEWAVKYIATEKGCE